MKKYRLNILKILFPVVGSFSFPMLFAQQHLDQNDENTLFLRGDGGETTQLEAIGAVSRIEGKDLKTYPDLILSNALQGRAAGLIVRQTSNGLGNNDAELFIRGQHRNTDNKAIVIIDGVERPLDDLMAEEIESIDILKDPVTKALYGPSAANGVILVKTKRGRKNEKVIRINAEMGAMLATRTPKYLNSYEYATLYNEARNNDGFPDLYLPHQLTGYQNSTGVNDVLYPDVDYYDYFMKQQSLYRKFTLEAYGGNEGLRYSLTAGYAGGGGFEKVGKSPQLDRINLRGNLDIRVTDYLTVSADVAGRMENRSWSAINTADFFTALSGNYPNEYPLTIPGEMMGLPSDSAGIPYFGASLRKNTNLLADLKYKGDFAERYITSQTNVGVDFDFNKYVKGLTANGFLTFDNYTYLQEKLVRNYRTFAPRTYLDETGEMQTEYTLVQKLEPATDTKNIPQNETTRALGWRANIAYENEFNLHHIAAVLGFRYYKNEQKGNNYDIANNNYNLRLNYNYDRRYFAEVNLVYMGSNKFMDGHKYFLSPTAGIGWVLSNEDFLAGNEQINYLKLKASYGVLGYSGAMGYDLYKTNWGDGGEYLTGSSNLTKPHYLSIVRIGNPDLKWEKSAEFNVGVEGMFLNDRLRTEINYFHETRSDIIGINSSKYAGYIGKYMMYENMGKVTNQGVDAYITWNDRVNRFSYSVGFNFVYSKNKLLEWDENKNIPEEDRKTVGKPTDAIFGLQSLGLFGRDVDINGHPVQMFGPYRNGDIAYADLNGDRVIDGRDEKMIGNSFPRATLGIDIQLKYKNWELYLLGTSELGIKKLLGNTYYWNKGDSKYSVLARDSYHPERNPGGLYPVLTTTDGANSFRNSGFWIENASYFRLKNVEISYTFPTKKSSVSGKGFRIYARGTNLFVISKIKDLDPEVPDAGVVNNPVTAYYTGGVSFTF